MRCIKRRMDISSLKLLCCSLRMQSGYVEAAQKRVLIKRPFFYAMFLKQVASTCAVEDAYSRIIRSPAAPSVRNPLTWL